MSWTDAADLKAQLARLWERGELARCVVTGEARFPLRLVLRGPSSTELSERFEAVRCWASALASAPRVRIERREVRHRVQGLQRLPEQAWIDSLDDALALVGKRREAERLQALVQQTQAALPELLPWLARRPLLALELVEAWPRLLAVVRWIERHPQPGIYLRQVDIPGVHTKFIELHRAVLTELIDLALPTRAPEGERGGIGQFARRYGFLDKPTRIRFRVLDENLRFLPTAPCPDVSLDAESFASLAIEVDRVFITENETNFLAFPKVERSIVIFGAGYGWDALASARWLDRCQLHYWGDIDTHGFAILSQLRGRFPHTGSLLMDRGTLLAHRDYWTDEPEPLLHDLAHLRAAEQALFDDLRDNCLGERVRLEQERVGFAWVLGRLGSAPESHETGG